MRSLLTLPARELAICLDQMRDVPREQHRRFRDVVADHINPLDDLTSEVICACAYARWLMQEPRR